MRRCWWPLTTRVLALLVVRTQTRGLLRSSETARTQSQAVGGFQKTKLSDVISVTGVTTVGIFTVGQSVTPVGVTSTSYVKGIVMHNIGIGSVVSSLYFYPTGENVLGHANTAFRMARVDLAES